MACALHRSTQEFETRVFEGLRVQIGDGSGGDVMCSSSICARMAGEEDIDLA